MCKAFLIPGQRRYPIHQKTYLITRFKVEHIEEPVYAITKNDLDVNYPGWEKIRPGNTIRYIPDFINKNILVVPQPRLYSTVFMDITRYPYNRFSLSNPSALPEIPDEYTGAINIWAMRQAYLKNDRETLSTARSVKFEQEFYRMIEQYRINHKIRQRPVPPMNMLPAGFL